MLKQIHNKAENKSVSKVAMALFDRMLLQLVLNESETPIKLEHCDKCVVMSFHFAHQEVYKKPISLICHSMVLGIVHETCMCACECASTSLVD